jgi:type I restriction enzyme, S subunit
MSGNWIRTRLGAAFTTMTGSTPSKADASLFGTFMPLIKPPELLDRPLDSAEDGLSEIGARCARTLPVESVLVSCIGNLGKVGLNTVPVAFNQQINAVLPDRAAAIPEFMFYQALSPMFKAQLEARATGTTVRIINKSKFNEIEIVLAPLPEQRRIVAILDEAFEGIATAKANAEKNLRNALELFETYLAEIFSQQGKVVPLSLCATDISDGDHAPPPKSSAGVPFITISNIDKESRRIDFSDTFTVSQEYFDALKPNRKPRKGDVLYTVTGSFGIPVLVEEEGFCFQRHIGLIRPKPDVDSHWLAYALLSPQVRSQAESGATGTAQRTVSLGVLRSMTVPKIAFEEQRAVAALVGSFSDEITRLKDIQRAKLASFDYLKKSLLHQAFTGQL